jgi:hypothetical protein
VRRIPSLFLEQQAQIADSKLEILYTSVNNQMAYRQAMTLYSVGRILLLCCAWLSRLESGTEIAEERQSRQLD